MKKYIMKKLEKAEEFYCTNCERDKKSKNIAFDASKPGEQICNGCYGFLLSKNLIVKG